MRKLVAVPMLAMILACGGGGIGGNSFSYPNSKTLQVTLRNASTVDAKVWVEPDETEPALALGAGSTRTVHVSRTWSSENQTVQFTFRGREGANPLTSANITITGEESHASNFSGFLVEWRKDTASGLTSIHATTQ